MKLLLFTDTHIRGNSPRNRIDDFYNTLKSKFVEISQICEEEKIDYILHAGDWFDRPDISPSVVREFGILIKKFNTPIYTIAGNHDLFGHNVESINRTMLGLLEGFGAINLIYHNSIKFLIKDDIIVQLNGSPYSFDIDSEKYKDYYCVKKIKGVNIAINMVHGMLLNKPFIEGVEHTLIKDIVETGADITFAGHYHSGFGIIRMEDKYFVNPGSLVRVSNSMAEIKRMPKVIIVEIKNDDFSIRERVLRIAKRGYEVLNKEEIIDSYERTIKLHQFYDEISRNKNLNKIDINQYINEIAMDKQIEIDVKEETINRIEIARTKLTSGDV